MDNLQKLYVSATNGDPLIISIIIAIVVILLTLIFLTCSGGASKKRGVLLMGLCDAGKTLIFTRLIYKKFISTQTSIKDNAATYTLRNKSGTVRLIDMPGHERLRTQYLDSYKAIARAIVFVVDSMTFQKDVRDVAEYIYMVLTDPVIQSSKPKVLIACNKSDARLAKGSKIIQSSLEREINLLRVTQSAALDSTTNTGTSVGFLGKKGKDFEFSDVRGLKVDFIECSARGAKDSDAVDLEALEDWLLSVA